MSLDEFLELSSKILTDDMLYIKIFLNLLFTWRILIRYYIGAFSPFQNQLGGAKLLISSQRMLVTNLIALLISTLDTNKITVTTLTVVLVVDIAVNLA